MKQELTKQVMIAQDDMEQAISLLRREGYSRVANTLEGGQVTVDGEGKRVLHLSVTARIWVELNVAIAVMIAAGVVMTYSPSNTVIQGAGVFVIASVVMKYAIIGIRWCYKHL